VRPARGAARAAARLGVRPEVGDDPRAPPGSCTREEAVRAGWAVGGLRGWAELLTKASWAAGKAVLGCKGREV
jgi:hypothetical protein